MNQLTSLASEDVIRTGPGNLRLFPQPLQSPSCYAQRFQVRFGGQFGLSKIENRSESKSISERESKGSLVPMIQNW